MVVAASPPSGVAGQAVALRVGSLGGGSRNSALRFVVRGTWRLELSPASTVRDAGDLQSYGACGSEAEAVASAGGGFGMTSLPVKTVPYG
jgi:hypothetical protein